MLFGFFRTQNSEKVNRTQKGLWKYSGEKGQKGAVEDKFSHDITLNFDDQDLWWCPFIWQQSYSSHHHVGESPGHAAGQAQGGWGGVCQCSWNLWSWPGIR